MNFKAIFFLMIMGTVLYGSDDSDNDKRPSTAGRAYRLIPFNRIDRYLQRCEAEIGGLEEKFSNRKTKVGAVPLSGPLEEQSSKLHLAAAAALVAGKDRSSSDDLSESEDSAEVQTFHNLCRKISSVMSSISSSSSDEDQIESILGERALMDSFVARLDKIRRENGLSVQKDVKFFVLEADLSNDLARSKSAKVLKALGLKASGQGSLKLEIPKALSFRHVEGNQEARAEDFKRKRLEGAGPVLQSCDSSDDSTR